MVWGSILLRIKKFGLVSVLKGASFRGFGLRIQNLGFRV
jgi:hypothetical protein